MKREPLCAKRTDLSVTSPAIEKRAAIYRRDPVVVALSRQILYRLTAHNVTALNEASM